MLQNELYKLAAIDIGSNAVRLLVYNIIESDEGPVFKKSALVRVPVRLGKDVFDGGTISELNSIRLTDAMKAFVLLMKVHGVDHYRACATSAMREARNGKDVCAGIAKATGIEIETIDGKEEAQIIAATDLHELIETDKAYLYVDVGGGSTEFTIFSRGGLLASRSFKIGTVRLLRDKVDKVLWKEVENWIKTHTADLSKLSIIGSGGNINKLHKMSGRKVGQPLSILWLNAQYQFLKSMGYKDRIKILGLNPDRADVIIPATRIFLSAAKWSGAKKIHVPKIGLADGIIKNLYHSLKTK